MVRKVMEALNLETGEYSPSKKINIKSEKVDLKNLINRDDKYGEYAWSVISKLLNMHHLWFQNYKRI